MMFHSFGRLVHGVRAMAADWSSRRELARLDDRMLADLGISRAQAEFEAHRVPWVKPATPVADAGRQHAPASHPVGDRAFSPMVSRF